MRHDAPPEPRWHDLVAWARVEVQATIGALPARLRDAAQALPVTYEHRPSKALLADGIEPDTLGLFVGGEFADGDHVVMPAQIILFLDNLWDFVGGDDAGFRDEVHVTVMHELGHYLGLNEDDLEDRGLE